MRRALLGLAVGVALLALPPGSAQACDSTVCLLLTRGGAGPLERGSFQLDVNEVQLAPRLAVVLGLSKVF